MENTLESTSNTSPFRFLFEYNGAKVFENVFTKKLHYYDENVAKSITETGGKIMQTLLKDLDKNDNN